MTDNRYEMDISGKFGVVVKDKDGNIVHQDENSNIVVDDGKQLLRNWLAHKSFTPRQPAPHNVFWEDEAIFGEMSRKVISYEATVDSSFDGQASAHRTPMFHGNQFTIYEYVDSDWSNRYWDVELKEPIEACAVGIKVSATHHNGCKINMGLFYSTDNGTTWHSFRNVENPLPGYPNQCQETLSPNPENYGGGVDSTDDEMIHGYYFLRADSFPELEGDGIPYGAIKNITNFKLTFEYWSGSHPHSLYLMRFDVYAPHFTPQNPYALQLGTNDANPSGNLSALIDPSGLPFMCTDIADLGNQKVRYLCELDETQANDVTWREIGLMMNPSGHVDYTLPTPINASGLFARAIFSQPWSKDNTQTATIYYDIEVT